MHYNRGDVLPLCAIKAAGDVELSTERGNRRMAPPLFCGEALSMNSSLQSLKSAGKGKHTASPALAATAPSNRQQCCSLAQSQAVKDPRPKIHSKNSKTSRVLPSGLRRSTWLRRCLGFRKGKNRQHGMKPSHVRLQMPQKSERIILGMCFAVLRERFVNSELAHPGLQTQKTVGSFFILSTAPVLWTL